MAITPSNSFSYNLPSIDRMCVNRVKVGYVELGAGKLEDDRFTVKKDDVLEEDGKYYCILNLKNFYASIWQVKNYEDSSCDVSISQLNFNIICYNKILVELPNKEENYIKISTRDGISYGLSKIELVENDKMSQINNGLNEFEVKSGLLITKDSLAKKIAKHLMNAYSKGRGYVEANWTGTPDLEIGDCFTGKSIKEQASYIRDLCK